MSFVNQVLAEAGGRKNLASTDHSVLSDVEFPAFYNESTESEEDSGPDFREIQSRYFRYFICALLILLIAFQVFNRLPVQESVDQLSFSHVTPITSVFAQSDLPHELNQHEMPSAKHYDHITVAGSDDEPFKRLVVASDQTQTMGFGQTTSLPDRASLKFVELAAANEETSQSFTPIQRGEQNQQETLHQDLLQQAIAATGSEANTEAAEKSLRPKSPAKFEIKPTVYSNSNEPQNGVFTRGSSQNADEVLNAARQFSALGQHVEAIQFLTTHLSRFPASVDARLLLATEWGKVGDSHQAIAVLENGLALTHTPSIFAEPLAHLYLENGQAVSALKILKNASPNVVADPEYHSFIAALQQQQGLHQDAILTYQSVLRVKPLNGKWWLGLGISMMAETRYQEAKNAFEKGLQDMQITPALRQFASQRLSDLKKQKDVLTAG